MKNQNPQEINTMAEMKFTCYIVIVVQIEVIPQKLEHKTRKNKKEKLKDKKSTETYHFINKRNRKEEEIRWSRRNDHKTNQRGLLRTKEEHCLEVRKPHLLFRKQEIYTQIQRLEIL